jgi:hypothetical protein
MTRVGWFLFVGFFIVALAGSALADKPLSKTAKEKAAKTACLSGDTAKGVALLAELYVDTRDVIYLFNQGRCFEQNGQYKEAIVRFREYQRKNADAGNPLDAEAKKHIADCQALLDEQKPAVPQAATPSLIPAVAPPASEVPHPAPAQPPHSTAPNSAPTDSVSDSGAPSPIAGDVAASEHAVTAAKGNLAHAGQVGAFVEFERVLLPGLSYGLGGGFEVGAGALLGYYKGSWIGLRYLFLDGAFKPGVFLAMPLFVVSGKAVAGVQGGATLQWDTTRHFGLFANLSLSYFPSAASDLGSLWVVPGVGVQVRL